MRALPVPVLVDCTAETWYFSYYMASLKEAPCDIGQYGSFLEKDGGRHAEIIESPGDPVNPILGAIGTLQGLPIIHHLALCPSR